MLGILRFKISARAREIVEWLRTPVTLAED